MASIPDPVWAKAMLELAKKSADSLSPADVFNLIFPFLTYEPPISPNQAFLGYLGVYAYLYHLLLIISNNL